MLKLVKEGYVDGWDDPRRPAIVVADTRLNQFAISAHDVGVAKFNSTIDIIRLENSVREHLNRVAPRMAVLDPIKLTITNWPEGHVEFNEAVNNLKNQVRENGKFRCLAIC